MTCVVFAFACEPDLAPEVGAAPRTVLARQIPRAVVAGLNGDTDRGFRFFPFLSRDGDHRRFVDLPDCLPTKTLCSLHGQDARPEMLADGKLGADRIDLRVIDAATGAVQTTVEVPYEAREPWAAVRHIMFEVAGALGWAGSPPDPPALAAPAVGWYLIARDELLALEADFDVDDPDRLLRAGVEAWRHAPEVKEVREVVLDTCRQLVRRRLGADCVHAALVEIGTGGAPIEPRFLEHAAAVVEAASGLEAAGPIWARLACEHPSRTVAVLKTGAALQRQGLFDEARAILQRSVRAGNDDPAVRAQLAAVEECAGDFAARDEILNQLSETATSDLAPPVLRLVASHLTESGRAEESLRLLDGALSHGDHAGLWLERARALICLHRADEARSSLEKCLMHGPGDPLRSEVKRLMQLTADATTLPRVQEVEAALAAGDVRAALRESRALVRRRRDLPEGWLFSGIAHQRAGHLRRAIRALRRAIELRPDFAEAHNRVGILLALRGDPEQAYVHLTRAVALAPNETTAWLHYAQVCHQLGRVDQAREALGEAERLGGFEEQVQYVKGLFSDPSL